MDTQRKPPHQLLAPTGLWPHVLLHCHLPGPLGKIWSEERQVAFLGLMETDKPHSGPGPIFS